MKSRTSLFMLLAAVALTFLSSPTAAVVYYVDGQNGQDTDDGLTWDTAKATIQSAVDTASTDDEIWVRIGNYAVSSKIQVDEAIGIYGGFAGDEVERSQRDWVNNVTTIDGQNSTRILQTADEPIIDGFTLINGYYDTSTDTESGGGAVYIGGLGAWDKTARISNCIMSDNTVYDPCDTSEGFKGGGAVYVGTGMPIFVNCLITNNSTNAYGGAVNLYSGSPQFINCTISKNTALKGGGAYLQGVGGPVLDAEFYNCIVSGNTGTSGANDLKVKSGGDDPQGSNNCSSVPIGTGTILTDPLFVDPASDDFHLQPLSPCIDAGTDSVSLPNTDLDMNARIMDGNNDGSEIVDIGAYEAGPPAIWYVDGTTSGDGTSWAQAFETIAEAITTAGAGEDIWVKAGTYAISSQIQVDETVGIYGGFAGDETERSQRDWVGNVTMMDGQNSTRILQTADEPIIDGFTFINGYYDTSTDTELGGGAVYIGGSGAWDKTARISNCIISNNTVYANPIGVEGFKGGGAVYVGTGMPIFVNCLITNNSTNAYGGAMNMYSGSPEFINCTISKNTAQEGGGVYLQGVGTTLEAEFYNCIVSGNTGTSDANDVKVKSGGDDPQGGNNCSSVQIGTGTILTDPLFVDPNSGDFHLQPGSPCIDAGDSNSVPADTTDLDADGSTTDPIPWDLDGRPRFIDDPDTADTGSGAPPIVDVGAYEFTLPCGDGDLPYPIGDINSDCGVNFVDFAIFGLCWLTEDGEPGWNINCNLYDADSIIDANDLTVFGEHWLTFAAP